MRSPKPSEPLPEAVEAGVAVAHREAPRPALPVVELVVGHDAAGPHHAGARVGAVVAGVRARQVGLGSCSLLGDARGPRRVDEVAVRDRDRGEEAGVRRVEEVHPVGDAGEQVLGARALVDDERAVDGRVGDDHVVAAVAVDVGDLGQEPGVELVGLVVDDHRDVRVHGAHVAPSVHRRAVDHAGVPLHARAGDEDDPAHVRGAVVAGAGDRHHQIHPAVAVVVEGQGAVAVPVAHAVLGPGEMSDSCERPRR